MALLLGAFIALVVLMLVLLLCDFDVSQTRRIEAQVARDAIRIRKRTLRGWSADRIAARYPDVPMEQIRRVRREMARSIAATQEIRLLETLWSLEVTEAEYE